MGVDGVLAEHCDLQEEQKEHHLENVQFAGNYALGAGVDIVAVVVELDPDTEVDGVGVEEADIVIVVVDDVDQLVGGIPDLVPGVVVDGILVQDVVVGRH